MSPVEERRLSLGGCRILEAISQQSKGTVSLPSQGPIFIVSDDDSIACCQLEPQRLPPVSTGPLHLNFDDRVQLVDWNTDEGDSGQSCVDILRKNTLQHYKIQEDDQKECGNLHRHTTILPETPSAKDSSFCGSSMRDPAIPLLSIGLREIQGNSKSAASVLSLARQKRQFPGIFIGFRDEDITTKVKLQDEDGEEVLYRVENITARRSNTKGFLYFILPSTMITLLPAREESSREPNPAETPITLPPTASPVARHLIQTVRCLRGSTRALVSKSCLLSGPPGVGKTYSIQQAFEVCRTEGPTLLISLGSLLGADSPSRLLQRRFETTAQTCSKDQQCVAIMFIDECDALLSNDRVAGMLALLLDQTAQDPDWQRIMVVAATNLADQLPASLRRPGRFDREIQVHPPNAEERLSILQCLLRETNHTITFDSLRDLAEDCVGYVAADLVALVRRVVALALEENRGSMEIDLFHKARTDVRASALRDSALLAPPKTQWSDIAGDPGGAQKTLRQAIEWPRTKREAFQALGLQPPKGILLYGPPGCAKTTLARAAAGAAGCAFIAFSPSDVYASSYVGEAESTIRKAFQLARATNPCILFFDEMDAIIGHEGSSANNNHGMNRGGGSSAESRVLSTFLNEMDGVDGSWKDGVMVLAATNRPWTLDKALLRSGRFDKAIYVPPPDYEGRVDIFQMFCKSSNLSRPDLEHLASDEASGSMTGAEIVGACRAAGMRAFKETIEQGRVGKKSVRVTMEHLKEALSATQPLLSEPGYLDPFLEFERGRLRL